jgi:putative transposase
MYFVTWCLDQAQPELTADEKDLVVGALRHFDAQRYKLIGYVVMNDHVHVVASPGAGQSLTAIIHSWTSYTANRMQRMYGRTSRVWQREYFDRVICDDRELNDHLEYILGNPG